MRSIFHAANIRPASVASAPVADVHSSQLVADSLSSEARGSRAGLSASSVEHQPDHPVDDDLRIKLAWYDGLFPKLDEHAKKYEAEMENMRNLLAEKERQIDAQRATIDHFQSANSSLERHVTKLKEQMIHGEQRIDELVNVVNSMRSQNVTKGVQDVPLSDIARNAIMEHLESENIRLTQEGLDLEKLVSILTFDHEQALRRLGVGNHAELDSIRRDLQREQATSEHLTLVLAQVTREKEHIEKEMASRIILEELDKKAKLKTQSKQLQDAIAYTKVLGSSARLRQNGVEVEFHHMATLCGIAHTQEKDIERLHAAVEQLRAENQHLKRETPSALPTGLSQNRTITFADQLPLRAEVSNPVSTTVARPTSSSRRRLQKRWSLSLQDLPPRAQHDNLSTARDVNSDSIDSAMDTPSITPTTPSTPVTPSKRHSLHNKLRRRSFSFGKAKTPVNVSDEVEQLREQLVAAQEVAMKHQHEKEALRNEIKKLEVAQSSVSQTSRSELKLPSYMYEDDGISVRAIGVPELVAYDPSERRRSSTCDQEAVTHNPLAADKKEGEEQVTESRDVYSYFFEDMPVRPSDRRPHK